MDGRVFLKEMGEKKGSGHSMIGWLLFYIMYSRALSHRTFTSHKAVPIELILFL